MHSCITAVIVHFCLSRNTLPAAQGHCSSLKKLPFCVAVLLLVTGVSSQRWETLKYAVGWVKGPAMILLVRVPAGTVHEALEFGHVSLLRCTQPEPGDDVRMDSEMDQ